MDKITFCEYLYEAYKGQDKNEDALKCLDYLLKILPRNLDYIEKYIELKGNKKETFRELEDKYKSKLENVFLLSRLELN